MKNFTIIFFLVFSQLTWANIVIKKSKIAVRDKIPVWKAEFTKNFNPLNPPTTGHTECQEVEELSNSFLCLSNSKYIMNLIFSRVSTYVEGIAAPNKQKHLVLNHSDANLNYYHALIGGHDLKVSDLMAFFKAVDSECKKTANDPDICLSDLEKQIYAKLVLPISKKSKEAVIISFSLSSSYQNIVSHEILHAQYFLNPEYQKIADNFWDAQVDARDKTDIKQTLAANYNVKDQLLLRNEFQAYILMNGAEYSELGAFVQSYRAPLMQALAAKSITPIQVK